MDRHMKMGRYEYTRRGKWARSLLVIGNFLFSLLGIAVIAVGIYLLINEIQFVPWVFGTKLMATSCGLIISAGSIMFLISFIGCFGTLYENRTMILAYCVVLSLVLMCGLMGTVLAIIFRAWVTGMVRVYMLESLMEIYGYEMENDYYNLVTRSWDEAQEKWECCSVDDYSWGIYRQSNWYKDLPNSHRNLFDPKDVLKPFVPASCCVRDSSYNYVNKFACQMTNSGPPGQRTGPLNRYLHYEGCFTAGKRILNYIAVYFIVIGFAFFGIVVFGVVCSLILYREL